MNASPITLQEIFDTSVGGLMKQGQPALDQNGVSPKCLYRTSDGLKCAVGMIIPDELYSPYLEERGLGLVCRIIGYDNPSILDQKMEVA